MIAADVAPGRNRLFRFMQWPGYDAGLWRRTLAAATGREKLTAVPMIRGSDRSAVAVRAATENAQRSGVGSVVEFERLDALRADPKSPNGWLVTNPPYGVRLGDEAGTKALMTQFARTLTQRFPGWRLALLAPARFERLAGIELLGGPRTTNGGLRVQILTGVVPVQEPQMDN